MNPCVKLKKRKINIHSPQLQIDAKLWAKTIELFNTPVNRPCASPLSTAALKSKQKAALRSRASVSKNSPPDHLTSELGFRSNVSPAGDGAIFKIENPLFFPIKLRRTTLQLQTYKPLLCLHMRWIDSHGRLVRLASFSKLSLHLMQSSFLRRKRQKTHVLRCGLPAPSVQPTGSSPCTALGD